MSAIFRLDQAATLEEGGGKWSSLTRLHALGAPVPEGFCIGAAVFRKRAATGAALSLARELDRAAESQLAELAGQIRREIQNAPFPAELAQRVRRAYASLGGGPVAVRSSATSEDLADASFAGQYDTLLDVRGEQALFDAIRSCWASAYTERVVRYRRRAAMPEGEVAMAVVVQRLVDASVSGVAFTRHPTQNRPVMLFEACPGLGEALVSGNADPDRFEVEREGSGVTSLSSAAGTGLSEQRLLDMRDRFLQLENAFGFGLDLEWSWEGDRLFLLQARPITAAPLAGEARAAPDARSLQGVGASPGVAHGAARVLLSPDDDELEAGDVLVTRFTDPRFMRHFQLAAALVMEHGGMLSHGAIVARECGIPAVIGVPAATSQIAAGSRIRVDGDSGLVTQL